MSVMGNFQLPKLADINSFFLNLNPLNPYVITVTAFLISGFSYLSYHICFGRSSSPVNLAAAPPAVDEISVHVAKSLLPPEDTFNKTYADIPTINHTDVTDPIPAEFDARVKWPACAEIIGKVWDQGTCQSCWAVSAASVMSDRLCIQSSGATKVILSPQHLICSCKNCTKNNDQAHPMSMCYGGDSEAAWEFWRDEGLVTGGDYGTNDTCLPYLSKPCIHNSALPPTETMVFCGFEIGAYQCPAKCNNSEKTIEEETKYKGSKIYYVSSNVADIQKELMNSGPVQVKFTFDEKRLMQHSKGLFTCSKEDNDQSSHIHSVKIIGWGVLDNVPYWLCINSYNTGWGEQGTFKIKRGVNMCKIEESVLTGLPELGEGTQPASVAA